LYLRQLSVSGFRNLGVQNLSFGPAMNVFHGRNAAGKTNLLEAVHLLATSQSHRTGDLCDVVAWGEQSFKVAGVVERQNGTTALDLTWQGGRIRAVRVDGQSQTRVRDILGRLAVVLFSPEDVELVKGRPSLRRRFLNMALCQVSPAYYDDLVRYRRALKQRNAILRRHTGGAASIEPLLQTWEANLAPCGAAIVCRRARELVRISRSAAAAHASLTGGSEELEIDYLPKLGGTAPEGDLERGSVERLLLKAYEERRQRDLATGITSVGPHRDDFSTRVAGRDLRSFGSQGQQRTAALALKMAELAVVSDDIGEQAVILFDDVGSELDPARRRQLAELVAGRGLQAFFSCTRLEELLPAGLETSDASVFRVENGVVIRED